jgi:hypothetical protein
VFTVNDVWDESKKIVGACDDTLLLRWMGDVVTMVANKADFEGFKSWIDICTGSSCQRCITLPREVETVLAVNIGGRPTIGFDQLFNFHLNGPGDSQPCEWSWQDQGGWHCTYRDLVTPAKLVVYTQLEADNGKEFIVYGYDDQGQVLRRQVNGVYLNGYQVPTIHGYAIPDSQAPTVARITGIFKASSAGSMRLSTTDNGGNAGTLLGVYEPDETTPQYRRIKVSRPNTWVRVAYMKSNPVFSSRYDHIPLRSRVGFLLGMEARKFYKDRNIADAHGYEADAARLELEAQAKIEPPTQAPIQVLDRATSLRDRRDFDIR